ncbi:MAG: M6 family metalloprotease domain-containing protein [Prevotellaceae bacterium]|nr:M6 family metalloprotease domain-containing protein [Prevotellaceae bacterium]
MKKGLLLFSLLAVSLVMNAIPAKRGMWKTIKLIDGSEVKVELVGDEHGHWYQAADGKCYTQIAVDKDVFQQIEASELMNAASARRAAANQRRVQMSKVGEQPAEPIVGEKRGLVILVQYKDIKFAEGHNKAVFSKILNQENYQEGDFKGSVKDYFKAQSDGKFILDFDVVGPVTLPQNRKYYGGNNPYTGQDQRPGEMAANAILAVQDSVDFKKYDWNNDGEVDQIYVLYAGKGAADSYETDAIWPHEWLLQWSDYNKVLNLGGMKINTYACGSELNGSGNISGIGTFCHEFSHCLGFPDFYDTKAPQTGGNYGMGSWDLMDNGSYNGNGYVPAGYTSYERMFAGWLTPIELKNDTVVSDMAAINKQGNAYIIYNQNNKDEYYLLEARFKNDWDARIPGAGLLVLHMDYDAAAWKSNQVNATSSARGAHQRLTVVHADNTASINNELTDVYPSFGNDSLTNYSKPRAMTYNANTNGRKFMNFALTNIKKNTTKGVVSFNFKNIVTADKRGTVVFRETFDQCRGTGANDLVWNTGANSLFTADNVGWTFGESKNYGAKNCARFGTTGVPGLATTPEINIDGETLLSFVAAPYANDKDSLYVRVEGGNATINTDGLKMLKGEWTEYNLKVNGNGPVKFTFSAPGRFFLDDVLVVGQLINGVSELNVPTYEQKKDNRIYSIDGRYMGTDFSALGRGIYIINGKKYVK